MWPVIFFNKLIGWAVLNTKKVAIIAGFFLWLIGFISAAVTAVVKSIALLLDQIDLTGLGNVDLAAAQWIGYFNAVIPISEMLGLLTLYYSIIGTITLIRWIKSFVPAIAN